MKEMKIYYTTDTHGCLYPSAEGSFFQCVGDFQVDGNTLVLDGGDNLQGSSLLKYLREKNSLGKTIASVFRLGGYHYFTLGNHDFSCGYEELKLFLQEMDATCLCANIKDKAGFLPFYEYEIRTLENGLRVGITAVVTDFVAKLESKENLENIEVTDSFTAAKKSLEAMKGQCDLSICIYHGGFEEDLDSGAILSHSGENIAGKLCRELDFDLILTGHQHGEVAGRYYHGTYVLQPLPRGQSFGEIYVQYLEPMTPLGAAVLGVESQLRKPSDTVPDYIYQAMGLVKEKSQQWLGEEIGNLSRVYETTEKITQAMEGSVFADLLQQVQLQASGAELSFAALPNKPLSLGKGVTVGSVLEAVPHGNKVVVLGVTGEVLLLALKRTASYFRWTAQGTVVDSRFLQPKPQHYHYEFVANVAFSLKLCPFGENVIEDVRVLGKALELERIYRVAVSDYRASGVGGYEMLRGCPVLAVVEKDIQDLVLDFFRQGGDFSQLPQYQQITFLTEFH